MVLLNVEFYMKGPTGTRLFDFQETVPKEIASASIEVLSGQRVQGEIK